MEVPLYTCMYTALKSKFMNIIILNITDYENLSLATVNCYYYALNKYVCSICTPIPHCFYYIPPYLSIPTQSP